MPYNNVDNIGIASLQDWHPVYKQWDIKFPANNEYDIPDILPYNGPIPDRLVGYESLGRSYLPADYLHGACVHCYIHDEKFESVWSRPGHALKKVQKVGYAISPDFSVYESFPYPVRYYNHYRSHWVAAFWQAEGIQVIPNASWSDRESFKMMFAGMPKYSTVAVASPGALATREDKKHFLFGYSVMLEWLMPTDVLFYGNIPDGIPTEDYELHTYQTKWQTFYEKGVPN